MGGLVAVVAVLTGVLTGGPSQGIARTIVVAPADSAETSVIQDAITAASVGDTILLTAGYYSDSFEWAYNEGAWTSTVFAAVTVDSLLIRGESRDSVVIGQGSPTFDSFGPKGIVVEVGIEHFVVENVTFQHVWDGLYTVAAGGMKNCLVRGSEIGVSSYSRNGLQVTDCEFNDMQEGVVAWSWAKSLEVDNCIFNNCITAFRGVATESCSMSNSTIDNCIVPINSESGAVMLVEGCVVRGTINVSVSVSDSHLEIRNCDLSGGWGTLNANGLSSVTGSGNIVRAASTGAILMQSSVTMDFRGNEIYAEPGGYAVKAREPVTGHVAQLDFTDNYWGTTDVDSIAALIWDANDEPAVEGIVEFLPIKGGPLPTEVQTFGSVKSLFR